MRVLVTGTSGFVAPFVIARLASEGHQAFGLDLHPRPIDARHGVPDLRIVEADVRDRRRVLAVVDEVSPDAIVHSAALIHTDDPVRQYEINVGGTLSILEAARARGLRVVFLSTASVYGWRPDLSPVHEDDRPNPEAMYETTKLMAETLAIGYHKVHGLDVVAVRPGFVYGPNIWTDLYLLEAAFAGRAIDLPTGGDLPMDVTYIRDLVDGVYRALTVRPLEHRVFNITGGVLRRVHEFVPIVRRLVPGAQIAVGPGIAPRSNVRGPSVLTRARDELGYTPGYTLEEGLADWLAWLQTPTN